MPADMDCVQELVARLNSARKLRAWSVIITFFGDAIVPRGGAVSARTVQQLLARLGVEAGAVRTAFSRLTTDGWVVREKIGRSSFYRLSPTGLKPFEEATDKIYAALPTASQNLKGWTLVLSKSGYPRPRLLKGTEVQIDALDQRGDCFIFEGNIVQIPQWMKSQNSSSDHALSFEALLNTFQPVSLLELNPMDSLAVRCLLIHEWRRILFQFEPIEPEFWPNGWPQTECHSFVSGLYHRLLPASERWMDDHGIGPEGPLGVFRTSLEDRFPQSVTK
jgi:phenylacetic acid degradation operon negative regulatory protein